MPPAPRSPLPILPTLPQRFPGEALLAMTRRPLEFLPALQRERGDVAGFRFGRQVIALLSAPDDIRDVFVTNARGFHKGRGLERAKLLLGEGLLTSEGEVHLRQRRLAQPAFHRARVAAYGETMARYAARRIAGWRDGATIDVSREMAAYTLAVVGKTLFDADIEDEAPEIGRALSDSLAAFNFSVLPFAELLLKLPFPVVRRFNRARARLDATIYRLIAERRASGEDRGDLLSMLLLAQDTEGGGGGMTDLQLRDEAMTILLAGHETTANALTWALHLVATHPDVAERLHAEVDALGAAPAGADDVARLPYARAVLAETMRLYPPAWIVGRRALEAYEVGGYTLPPRTIVLMSQWVVHRDPRWWPDAGRFQPARWLAGGSANDPARPKFSYFPFGAGTRVCIGEQFAWMEGVLALAAIVRGWRLEMVPGHPVVPQPIVTLRAKHGMRMVVRAR
ncbi:MAG: Cytochrome [Gemmatimonadetes bacterium]|jgi:cytochrome P450|nr:Cytochrome [Gemmatimonadota bacterium]